MTRFKELIRWRKVLVLQISRFKKALKEKKNTDKELLSILQEDMVSLSDLIDKEKKRKRFKFIISGWAIEDNSSLRRVHIEFQITFPLTFPGRFNLKKDGEEPFMRVLGWKRVKQQIESLEKKYEIPFSFSCKVIYR